MTETLTIPAHVEDGVIHLDGALPKDVVRIEVLAHRRTPSALPTGLDILAFLDALPPGIKSKAELDRRLDAERDAWE